MKLKINNILLLLSISYINQNINASSIKRSGKIMQPVLQKQYVTLPSMWTHEEVNIPNKETSENETPNVPSSWISKFKELYNNQNVTYPTIGKKYPNIDEKNLKYTGASYNTDGTKAEKFEDDNNNSIVINYNNGLKMNATIFYHDGTIEELEFDKYNKNVKTKAITNPNGAVDIKFYNGIVSWLLTPLPSDYDIYIYDKNGNNVGPSGTYDENGLDRYGRTAGGRLEELD